MKKSIGHIFVITNGLNTNTINILITTEYNSHKHEELHFYPLFYRNKRVYYGDLKALWKQIL
jgi:hypothetical protein